MARRYFRWHLSGWLFAGLAASLLFSANLSSRPKFCAAYTVESEFLNCETCTNEVRFKNISIYVRGWPIIWEEWTAGLRRRFYAWNLAADCFIAVILVLAAGVIGEYLFVADNKNGRPATTPEDGQNRQPPD